jgi:hypothetical protein
MSSKRAPVLLRNQDKKDVDLPENNTEQTNEKTTFKVNDNELEQTNC